MVMVSLLVLRMNQSAFDVHGCYQKYAAAISHLWVNFQIFMPVQMRRKYIKIMGLMYVSCKSESGGNWNVIGLRLDLHWNEIGILTFGIY